MIAERKWGCTGALPPSIVIISGPAFRISALGRQTKTPFGQPLTLFSRSVRSAIVSTISISSSTL